jgi:hypothetical protein
MFVCFFLNKNYSLLFVLSINKIKICQKNKEVNRDRYFFFLLKINTRLGMEFLFVCNRDQKIITIVMNTEW